MKDPADSTAAISTASAKAKLVPTSRPSRTSPATWIGSLGMCWPCIAIGVSPTEIPTAITPLTTGGITDEEKIGASRNSGVHARARG